MLYEFQLTSETIQNLSYIELVIHKMIILLKMSNFEQICEKETFTFKL